MAICTIFKATVRHNNKIEIVYSKQQLLQMFRPTSKWTADVASSYFTPSKLKKWDLPKYLKEHIISIERYGVLYNEQTANNR